LTIPEFTQADMAELDNAVIHKFSLLPSSHIALVHLCWLKKKKKQRLGNFTEHKFISHSSGDWKVQDQGASAWLVTGLCFQRSTCCCILHSGCVLTQQKRWKCKGVLPSNLSPFVRVLIPLIRAESS
jgi:hypothetical protein